VRAAPPVSLSCPRGGAWRWLLTLLPTLAVGVGTAWALTHLERSTAWAVVPVALVGLTTWRTARADPVLLAWDGQHWLAEGEAGDLKPMLDLHRAMLLQWRSSTTRRVIWLPVTAHGAGPTWHALRVAVFARRPPAQPPSLHV
jgi:hypothetical protein